MKIVVVGHLCLDVICHPDSTCTEGYGGIFFSIAALANLLSPDDVVVPVLGIGKTDYDAFAARLGLFSNVSADGLFRFGGPTSRVQLYYNRAGPGSSAHR